VSPRMVMPDGSSWPKPDGPVDSLEWTLRYGTPTREDMLRAAGVVAAYSYLTLVSSRDAREMVCRELRKAQR